MDAAKIRLSTEEKELMLRADWILTKNGIIQKLMAFLGAIQNNQQIILNSNTSWLPAEVLAIPAKVSKGENYKGLPYLILDQPRFFNRDHIFTIRSLFWWGHFFSVTLHLSGSYKTLYEQQIITALPSLQENSYYICVNTDQWEHHFEPDNFIPLQSVSLQQSVEIIEKQAFLKLSKKIPLESWEKAGQELVNIFNEYIRLLKTGK
jgi:hypothetical protein